MGTPKQRREMIIHYGNLSSRASRDAQSAARNAVRSIRTNGKDGIEAFMKRLDDEKLRSMMAYVTEHRITDVSMAETLTGYYVREFNAAFERLLTVAMSFVEQRLSASDGGE